MNTAPKTSLRLIASALALAAGLAISAVSGTAVAQSVTELGYQRSDVVRAPVTRRGGALERGVPTAFGLSTERPIDVARAPVTRRGGTPERGAPTAFSHSTQRPIVVARAPVTRRGGAPSPAGGDVWIGLAAGY